MRKRKSKPQVKHPVLHVLDHEPTRDELHKALVELDGLRLCIGNVWLNVTEEMKRLRRLYREMQEMLDMSLRPTIIKPVKPAVKPVVRPIEVTILAPKRKSAKKKTTTTKSKETKK
jgi:hypothetical protein